MIFQKRIFSAIAFCSLSVLASCVLASCAASTAPTIPPPLPRLTGSPTVSVSSDTAGGTFYVTLPITTDTRFVKLQLGLDFGVSSSDTVGYTTYHYGYGNLDNPSGIGSIVIPVKFNSAFDSAFVAGNYYIWIQLYTTADLTGTNYTTYFLDPNLSATNYSFYDGPTSADTVTSFAIPFVSVH